MGPKPTLDLRISTSLGNGARVIRGTKCGVYNVTKRRSSSDGELLHLGGVLLLEMMKVFFFFFFLTINFVLDDIDTLMIFIGYLVLVWICDTKLSLYYISTHAFMVCFQCFRNLQVNSFTMLLSIVATCR